MTITRRVFLRRTHLIQIHRFLTRKKQQHSHNQSVEIMSKENIMELLLNENHTSTKYFENYLKIPCAIFFYHFPDKSKGLLIVVLFFFIHNISYLVRNIGIRTIVQFLTPRQIHEAFLFLYKIFIFVQNNLLLFKFIYQVFFSIFHLFLFPHWLFNPAFTLKKKAKCHEIDV